MEQQIHLLKDFSNQEKTAYLGAIASITSADRVASDEEIEYLRALTESADLSSEEESAVLGAAKDSSNMSLQQNLSVLKNGQLKYSLITDIISFAKSDGKYSEEEASSIEKIAQYLDIDQDQFNVLAQTADKVSQGEINEDTIRNNFSGSSPASAGGLGGLLSKVGISPSILTGSIGMLAPMILSKIMGRRSSSTSGGGLLGGLLGNASGGQRNSSGGLGSLLGMLTGGRGYSGMGSVLGGLFSGK
jgi:uncharacterized tellurite resistance protein B-like protein